MRKSLIIAGIVVLIIGLSFYGVMTYETGLLSHKSITEIRPGEYVSDNFTADYNYIVTIKNPTPVSGLVSLSNLDKVTNASMLYKYKIRSDYAFGNVKEYEHLAPGKYVFVDFSNSRPALIYESEPSGFLVEIGYLDYASVLVIILGPVISIIGIFTGSRKIAF
ncbi:hypothetical protein [Picrophilus oshimae]|uniref:Hypothetical membrane associated protein n=1 Tax=Picrophilus torridus (strain ATCC 700027 / DSM 9790 / JCM 10055 / NBRC 100828 / KAW 2/3) TaxID=1122961 RepID=Q6KZE2_PICTO|nr:hypothetical protein [Picrophilus oshimae]AAT43910.1 hypothetical membrane associated protein [Picrophilus oshimae DSM 9789]